MTAENPLTLLSLVIPVFNEEEVLPLLLARLDTLLEATPCAAEVVFVDDGSADRTAELLAARAAADPRVKVVRFARNFGHQVALTAGLEVAAGDAVVALDADLQDPPEVVEQMIERYRAGAHVVYAERLSREDEGPIKRGTAAVFYRLMRWFVHPRLPVNVGDFRLMSRPAVDALNRMPERARFIRGMVAWLGFPCDTVYYHRPGRAAGEAKYTFWKSLRLAWHGITSFSVSPLRLSLVPAGAMLCFGLGYAAYALALGMRGEAVPGWATIVVLLCLFFGTTLLCLGFIGEYIGRIYEELQARPLYVVRSTTNLDRRPPPGGYLGVGLEPPAG